MMGAMAARGAAQSGMAQRETRRVHETHRRRRRGRRILAALAIAVAVSAFGTAYTRNRFAVGVRTAAIASAAPVALYLGLRRDE
jgi:hypothetical protein